MFIRLNEFPLDKKLIPKQPPSIFKVLARRLFFVPDD